MQVVSHIAEQPSAFAEAVRSAFRGSISDWRTRCRADVVRELNRRLGVVAETFLTGSPEDIAARAGIASRLAGFDEATSVATAFAEIDTAAAAAIE